MKAFTKTNKFARVAVAMVCALLLAVTVVCPAFAAVGDGTGTITVSAGESGNSAVTYNAYKIFTADVDETSTAGSYKATNIEWANDSVKTAVEGVLRTADNSYPAAGASNATAQYAANYLNQHITGTDSTTRVDANSLANKLADAIDETTVTTTLQSGTKSGSIDEGYYLIVAKGDSLGEGEAGTSPIFTMLGEGQDLTITEKVKVPTLTKAVKKDSDSTTGKYADAQMGQATEFVLTGTVADNINTYGTYAYTFTDTLPTGMDYVANSVAVKITTGSTETTVASSSYTVNYASNELTVGFTDLKVAKDASGTAITINGSSVVTVTYNAALNSNASMGAANANTATLTYSSNPNTTTTGVTTSAVANVYTYALKLLKVQKGSESTTIPGAEFTIQATTPDDEASKDRYVQADGKLGSDAYAFVTDSSGAINVKGLDAGTYTITETEAPSKYKVAPAITLTITPSFENDALKNVGVTLTGGNADGTDTNSDGTNDTGTRASYADGTITLTVTDAEGDSLPITGLNGIAAVYVVGGVLFAVSVATIVRRRSSNE